MLFRSKLGWGALQQLIMSTVFESGEILVRIVRQKFADSRVPLALEIIESDQIVETWNGKVGENGNEIRMGVEVTIVEPQPTPLASVLGTEIGELVARLHRAEGVDVRTGVGVAEVRGTDRVRQVVLLTGRNDLAQGRAPEAVAESVGRILGYIPQRTVVVLLGIPTVRSGGNAVNSTREANRLLFGVCAARPGCATAGWARPTDGTTRCRCWTGCRTTGGSSDATISRSRSSWRCSSCRRRTCTAVPPIWVSRA